MTPHPFPPKDHQPESATVLNTQAIGKRAEPFARMPKPLYKVPSDPEYHPQRYCTREGIEKSTTYTP